MVIAAQTGVPGAMEELLARHKEAMLRTARRFAERSEDAEDLVQDAMLRALLNIGRFRKESRIGTWLIAIVKNAALSMRRRTKVAAWVSIDDRRADGAQCWDVPDTRSNPERSVITRELLRIIGNRLSEQTTTQQMIVQACVLEEQPTREVAQRFGTTLGSVKSHLYRIRQGLTDLRSTA